MNEELYFIPIIVEAMRQPAVEPALRDAFAQIEDLGRDPALRVGYQQYLRFMDEARRALMADEPHESPGQAFFECERSSPLELWLERGDVRVGALELERIPQEATFLNLQPGAYRLRTDTGWTLWEATLTPRELIWAEAFPQKGLPLAAQTEEVIFPVTREVSVLDGALTIRVRPGLESGVLELLFTKRRNAP